MNSLGAASTRYVAQPPAEWLDGQKRADLAKSSQSTVNGRLMAKIHWMSEATRKQQSQQVQSPELHSRRKATKKMLMIPVWLHVQMSSVWTEMSRSVIGLDSLPSAQNDETSLGKKPKPKSKKKVLVMIQKQMKTMRQSTKWANQSSVAHRTFDSTKDVSKTSSSNFAEKTKWKEKNSFDMEYLCSKSSDDARVRLRQARHSHAKLVLNVPPRRRIL